MTKTFKCLTDSKDYGESELELKKGDIFKLIDIRLWHITKIDSKTTVYDYRYLISVPKKGCFIINEDDWLLLMALSEYIDN